MGVGPKYCSQNGGNSYRAPYYREFRPITKSNTGLKGFGEPLSIMEIRLKSQVVIEMQTWRIVGLYKKTLCYHVVPSVFLIRLK